MKHPNLYKDAAAVRKTMIWERERASFDWRDGMLLGNGSLAAISYAPGGLEWIVNKNDVYDPRYPEATYTPHSKMMELLSEREDNSTWFIEKAEHSINRVPVRSVTPVILRFMFGNGELGWNAPAFPKIGESLDLSEGILNTFIDAHLMHSGAESLIPRGRNVLAVRVSGISICDASHKTEIYRPYQDDMEEPEWHNGEGVDLAFSQSMPGGGSYAVALSVVPREPDPSRLRYTPPTDWSYPTEKGRVSSPSHTKLTSSVYASGDVDIFLSVVSSRESQKPLQDAVGEVIRAVRDGYEKLRSECREWWDGYWQASSVDLGKYTELEKYWYFSAYEIAASYGTSPVPALAGMFYGPLTPSVSGLNPHNYTTDQNTQIPVLPFPLINHPELIIPYVKTHLEMRDVLRRHTKRLFGENAKGLFIPLVMNQDGHEFYSGLYRYTMCGGAYTATVIGRVWEFTRDRQLMGEYIFPLMRELINHYAYNVMHLGDDGLYHLDPSVPPEIFYMTEDETSTVSMLRAAILSALSYIDEVGISDEDTELWRDVISKLPPIARRRDGAFWCGKDVPEDHFSFGTHILYPIFPSEAYLSEEEREAGRRTLDYIANEAIERTHAGLDGWHFLHDWSWHLYYSVMARVGDKEKVWCEIPRFIELFGKPNGLFAHNSIVIADTDATEENHKKTKRPDEICADMTNGLDWYGAGKGATANPDSKRLTAPVVEGNSVYILRLSEALLQSFDGVVRVFDGVPNDFTGAFSGHLAKGGFKVSAAIKEGKVVRLSVEALADATLRLFMRGEYSIPLKAVVKDGILALRMKFGECVDFVN